jgi:hypothetical protein
MQSKIPLQAIPTCDKEKDVVCHCGGIKSFSWFTSMKEDESESQAEYLILLLTDSNLPTGEFN